MSRAISVSVPLGPDGSLALDLPPRWSRIEVARADRSGWIADYQAALALALDRPLGPPLDTLLGPGLKVAVVVDDPSRWTPVADALPVVLDRLRGAGVQSEDVSISVGVGRHHAVDAEAMARRVGSDVAARHACHSPPVDDLPAYADLGDVAPDLPARVFRPVAEADLRILIGSVLPHLQAGFGGGYKLIAPGCAHRSTLAAVHRRGLDPSVPDAARLLGSHAAANPMRRAVRAIAAKLGPCFSISHALGAPGEVFRVEAGDPDLVQDALAAEVERRYRAPDAAEPADVVVAGNFPWPGDPMQSFKVLLNHRAAGRRGGALVGLFWTDPDEIDRSFPMAALRGIALSGVIGAEVLRRGLATADRVAARLDLAASFMVRWARELVVDREVFVYAPPLRERVGARLGPVRLFADQAELWAAVDRLMTSRGVASPLVRIFPEGGLTYAPHPDGPLGEACRP